MARTESRPLSLGMLAPDFALPDTDGRVVRRSEFAGKPLLVVFMCNHCPYVKLVRSELARLGRDLARDGVGMVGINSNDVSHYPDDSPEKMREEKASAGYVFPYLFDATQEVARAYDAACTPEAYLFDRDGRLVYHGQLDDSRPSNSRPPDGADIRAAITAVLADKPVSSTQKAALGCNIKWKQ